MNRDQGDHRIRDRLRAAPSRGSWIGALLLWWPSLRPTLLPRAPMIQGAVSALCIAVGYGLGGLIGRTAGPALARALDRRGVRFHRERSTAVTAVLTSVTLLAVVTAPVRWLHWQRQQRRLVRMGDLSWTAGITMLVWTALLTVVLLGIARLVRHLIAWVDRKVAARLSGRAAEWTVVGVVTVGAVLVVTLAVRQFAVWADTNFSTFDGTTADGVERPSLPTLTAGPGSPIAWDSLGYEGRNFVGTAPTAEELAAFDPSVPTKDPVRVYVGLETATSTEGRVTLALEELRRTGAFDRKVLVVVTPTGTGWVDPDAARTIEYMYGGDTAIVAVQYSFLPSWIAFLLDTKSPRTLGRELFTRVQEEWASLPTDDRPVLLAFGESLGSMGGESTFGAPSVAKSVQQIVDGYDGALFTGPTRNNAVFGALVDQRDAGSPSWRPALAAVPNLRVANKVSDIDPDDTTWASPRVLWVHHPSDAIGTWQVSNLWSPPGWGDDPPPYDVPGAASWVPFVTFAQETFDLMAGFSAAPGFGHDYRTDFVHAWAAIAPPDGWTPADSDRLQAFLGLDDGPDAP